MLIHAGYMQGVKIGRRTCRGGIITLCSEHVRGIFEDVLICSVCTGVVFPDVLCRRGETSTRLSRGYDRRRRDGDDAVQRFNPLSAAGF